MGLATKNDFWLKKQLLSQFLSLFLLKTSQKTWIKSFPIKFEQFPPIFTSKPSNLEIFALFSENLEISSIFLIFQALMTFLCESIDREYKTINVQCLIPALVATKMTYYTVSTFFFEFSNTIVLLLEIDFENHCNFWETEKIFFFQEGSTFVVTPENFCRQAVGSIGLTKKTAGCLNHELQMLGFHFFPWTILKYIIMPIYYHQRQRVSQLHNAEGVNLEVVNSEASAKKSVRDSATA